MARYTPGSVPDAYVATELDKISSAMDSPDESIALDTLYSAPTKYRAGTIALADGTSWDPGSGAGVYCYYAGSWHYLG